MYPSLSIPLITQNDRSLDEASGFSIPRMLFAPFRSRTPHIAGTTRLEFVTSGRSVLISSLAVGQLSALAAIVL